MGKQKNTTQAGYGAEHQHVREQWRPLVESGQVQCHADICLHISRQIQPEEPWDMGHNVERTAWTGPEHQKCNRSEGANRKLGRAPKPLETSRDWYVKPTRRTTPGGHPRDVKHDEDQ